MKRRSRTVKPTIRLSASGAVFGLFCFKFIRQTKGAYAGRPLALEIFQIEIVSELLRCDGDRFLEIPVALHADPVAFWTRVEKWVQKLPPRGRRVYLEGLIGLPKKNGKSTLAAAIALFLLIADDEPGAEVFSAASSKDQARIVFGQARAFVVNSPRLDDRCTVLRNEIVVPETDSVYRVVSADAPRLEGINPNGNVIDELHAHGSGDLYDVLISATIGREEPLTVSITTAGFDLNTIGGETFKRGAGENTKRIRYDAGVVRARRDKEPSFFFHWRGVPDDKLEDREAWKLANPAPWITLERLEKVREAAARRNRLEVFQRYHLNRWVRVGKRWLALGLWDSLAGDASIEIGDPLVAFVDAGVTQDTSALVAARPAPATVDPEEWDPEDPDGKKIAVGSWVWAPWPDAPKNRPSAHFPLEGQRAVDLGLVENKIRDLADDFDLIAVGYDPAKFQRSAQILEAEGFPMIEFPQSDVRMVSATETATNLITLGLVVHAGDEVLATHVENTAIRDTGRGVRVDKRRRDGSEPMDAGVALVGALAFAENRELVQTGSPGVTVLG